MPESADHKKIGKMRLRTRLRDGVATVRAIIYHPMETGFRMGEDGLVPAHYIVDLWAYHNDTLVLHCEWSRAISKNPYLSFMFEGANVGDQIRLRWEDNMGQSADYETIIS